MVRVGPETVKLLSHFLLFWSDYYKVYSVIVRPVHCMWSHKRPQKQKLDDERTHSVYSVCTQWSHRRNPCSKYSPLHCEQYGRAVKIISVPRFQVDKMSLVVIQTVHSPCQASQCWVDCSRLVVQRQRDFCHIDCDLDTRTASLYYLILVLFNDLEPYCIIKCISNLSSICNNLQVFPSFFVRKLRG